MNEHIVKLEAILFVHGEAIGTKKIADILGISPEEARAVLEEYKKALEARGGALTLLIDREKAQLVTKPEFGGIVEGFLKSELTDALTPAALETLAIVAYFGPIGRAKLDYIRGVNSTFTLRNLSMRGLIDRMPDPARSQSFLYQPSFEAWKHLGVSSREELPEFEKFSTLIQAQDAAQSE